MAKSKFDLWKKYWCPPLWLKRTAYQGINLSKKIFERYPLADQCNSISCAPMFIISSGRSGTTLMRSMLVASGEIAIPAETQVIHHLAVKFPQLFQFGWNGVFQAIIAEFESHPNFPLWEADLSSAYQKCMALSKNERSLARIIDEVYRTYASQKLPNAKMWGDQSPIHTFALPYIKKIFPNAKYMHLLRDGRDVISSMVKRHGDDYLREAVYRWKMSIKRIDNFQKKIPPENYLEVRYEDLVNHPEDVLKRVSLFLEITYTNKMLDYWKLPTTVEHKYKTFHANLGKPVFPTSVGKWKERLNEKQQVYILEKITPELMALGYIN